jgi:hypothetical protein
MTAYPNADAGRGVGPSPGKLQTAGATPPAIEVTPVDEIRREGGHGAKLKLIQTTVHQPARRSYNRLTPRSVEGFPF